MIPFRKMHGLGNDFVIIDNRHGQWSLTEDQVRLVSDRRFGVGCDQLIIMEAAKMLRLISSCGSITRMGRNPVPAAMPPAVWLPW